jgi:hypothetical protein
MVAWSGWIQAVVQVSSFFFFHINMHFALDHFPLIIFYFKL